MSTYDLINKLEKLDYFNELLKSGLVPVNWIDYKVIYEFYKKERISCKYRKQALTNTADEFSISERSVYLIIQKMNG